MEAITYIKQFSSRTIIGKLGLFVNLQMAPSGGLFWSFWNSQMVSRSFISNFEV